MSGLQALRGAGLANRRALRIGLAVALVLTVLASVRVLHTREDEVVQVAERPARLAIRTENARVVQPANAAEAATAVKPLLAVARLDPFYLPAPPVPVAKAPAPPPAPVAAPPPVPAAPPPFNYQFFGRMRGPDGKQAIYLSGQDRLIPIGEGTELDGGYRVERIQASEILIKHLLTEQEIRVTLPIES